MEESIENLSISSYKTERKQKPADPSLQRSIHHPPHGVYYSFITHYKKAILAYFITTTGGK